MRRKLVLLLTVLLSVLFVSLSVASAQTHARRTGTEYIISAPTVTVEWDAVSVASAYEARLVLLDTTPVTVFALARGAETSIVFTQPHAGHLEAQVRACRYSDCHDDGDIDPDVSAWATSQLDGVVDGVDEPWWIYWKLAGVTDPHID